MRVNGDDDGYEVSRDELYGCVYCDGQERGMVTLAFHNWDRMRGEGRKERERERANGRVSLLFPRKEGERREKEGKETLSLSQDYLSLSLLYLHLSRPLILLSLSSLS